jgi:hypothetical protein
MITYPNFNTFCTDPIYVIDAKKYDDTISKGIQISQTYKLFALSLQ